MADLTTLAAVKSRLAIAPSMTASDVLLATLITATSADFLRAIDRWDFLAADYVEVREGDGGTRLSMRHWPINSVAALTVGGVGVSSSPDKVAAGYYFEMDLDPERRSQIYMAGGSSFTDGLKLSVSYNAGYATVPQDVDQAVLDWVALRYRTRDAVGVSSQRDSGGEQVDFTKDTAMLDTTAGVVKRYKRAWPGLDKRNDDRDYRVTRINRTITTMEKGQ